MNDEPWDMEFWALPEKLSSKESLLAMLDHDDAVVIPALIVELAKDGLSAEIDNIIRDDLGESEPEWPPPIRIEIKHGTPRDRVETMLRGFLALIDDDESWELFLKHGAEGLYTYDWD